MPESQTEIDELVQEIEKIARGALIPLGGWGPDHQKYVDAARRALEDHADAGGFRKWGITARAQLEGLLVAVGFDSHLRTFTLNPLEMARYLIKKNKP